MKNQIRTLNIQTRIVDEGRGLVDYVASDETIDSYGDVIRAKGWRFSHFRKNAPFVDSHDYSCISKLLGKVVDFRLQGSALVERVQWAIDVPENELARIGWQMTVAGYLKAVSVGFAPVKWASRRDTETWQSQLDELGLDEKDAPRGWIFIEQEQLELSSCIMGANPNALAKAYKGDAITEEDLDTLARISQADRNPATGYDAPTRQSRASQSSRDDGRRAFLRQIDDAIKSIA